jgi:subtilisin-like proprotein convertase family protein
MRSPFVAGRPGRLLQTLVVSALVAAFVVGPAALAAGKGEPGPVFPARVELADELRDLKLLSDLGIDIDAVFYGWARVYLVEEERQKLELLGFEVTVLPDEAKAMAAEARRRARAGAVEIPPTSYHTYETLTTDLHTIALANPDLVRVMSIGQSVQGRELWMVKVTDNPDMDEDEAEVSYIAAMHGDEVVGKELVISLIQYLTENYGVDPRVTDLVDDTEIWIMPSMNPDGTAMGTRNNANGVNLNRDFPDQHTDPVNTPDGRQPETQAVMLWGFDTSTNLSANMHGGALVANYPWDSNASGQSVYSPSPDDSVFVSVSRTYADNGHPSYDNGICNGADWYMIRGGMQDWNYVWRGNKEITLELGDVKWPSASTLPGYWYDNLESMLAYFERVHEGLRGFVTDQESGAPLAATIVVFGNEYASYSDPDLGDYHRVLGPGNYTLEISATGYSTRVLEDVVVTPGPAARYDVALEPLAVSLYPESARVVDGPSGNGRLDPGETADLAVTLRNLGRRATSIHADLVPIGWFATAPRPGASYPDLDPGETGECLAPYYQVSVSPDVPEGHKVGFALHWTSDGAEGTTEPLFLPLGDPQCATFPASDVPKSILNHQSTTSALFVSTELELYDVLAEVHITHGYIGDLRVELISPSGTPVILHDRTGGSSNDIDGTYGDDLSPFEPLARFRGETSRGTWTLKVSDGVGGNVGTLDAWSVEVCGRPLEATPPEMRFRRHSVEPDGAVLEWWPYPGLDSYHVYRATDATSADGFVDVTAEDDDATDTRFLDTSTEPLAFFLVTGEGPNGEGPKGHFGE